MPPEIIEDENSIPGYLEEAEREACSTGVRYSTAEVIEAVAQALLEKDANG